MSCYLLFVWVVKKIMEYFLYKLLYSEIICVYQLRTYSVVSLLYIIFLVLFVVNISVVYFKCIHLVLCSILFYSYNTSCS